SLVAIPAGKVRRVVCASPHYLRKFGTPKSPEDLRQHRCVRFTSVSPGPEWVFYAGRKKIAIPIDSAVSSNQVDAAVDLCINALGLGMFLSYQVATHVAAKTLRYVLTEHEPEPLPVHVIYPHSRLQSPKVRAFVDACVSKLRETDFD
ncbi:MAG: LysR substrate-binding domain-containing protein, partial [Candidatus Binataceae bacterium]